MLGHSRKKFILEEILAGLKKEGEASYRLHVFTSSRQAVNAFLIHPRDTYLM